MKVALCLAGQFRTFDCKIVYKSLKHFILDKYDCDIFVSTWANRGISYAHGNIVADRVTMEQDIITDEIVRQNLPIKGLEIEDFNVWVKSLTPSQHSFILRGGISHRGCLPQLYKKMRVIELMRQQLREYDYVILTRPDLFLWNYLDIESHQQSNTVYTINVPNTFSYSPNRIYDIFVMGKSSVMQQMAETYNFVENLLDDPYRSNLQFNDCCKMMYIYAKKYCNFYVDSIPYIPGDIFRGKVEEDLSYYSSNVGFDKDCFTQLLNLT